MDAHLSDGPVGFWRRLTIHAQLVLLYSGVMALLVVAVSTLSYVSVRQILQRNELSNTRAVLEQVRNNVDSALEQIDKLSYVVFADTEVLATLRAHPQSFQFIAARDRLRIERLLTDVLFARDDIRGLVLYNTEGDYVATQRPDREVAFETLAAIADDADGSLVWVPRRPGSATLMSVRKIYDGEMHPMGYLRIDVWADHMVRRLSESVGASGGTIAVFQHGEEVLRTASPGVVPQLLLSTATTAREATPGPDTPDTAGDASYAVLDHDDVRVTDRDIVVRLRSRVSEWLLVGVTPLDVVLRDVRRIGGLTSATTVLAILVFIAASSWIAGRLTRPIREIAEQMNDVDLGDWSPQLIAAGSNEIAVLAGEFRLMVERIGKLAAEAVETESQNTRRQLDALQAQINPHFIYNTLDVVSWMARRQDSPNIAEIVGALSTIMRYSVSSEPIATLRQELRHVELYLLIQQARFRDRFVVTIDVPQQIEMTMIPKLTLQPLIENAISHGFKAIGRRGMLVVVAQEDGDSICVTIADNGRGMHQEQVSAILSATGGSRGIGVANVHRRLQLTYGVQFGLSISSAPDAGTIVTVRLPKESARDAL